MNAPLARPIIGPLRSLTVLERFLMSPLPIRVEGERFCLCPDKDGPVADFAGAETPAGELFDIIAWLPPFAEKWWTLRGLARILGERELLTAELHGEPLKLFETPAAWRRSRDPYSACLIDWTSDPRFIFPGVSEVVCETERLSERLRQRIQAAAAPSFKISCTRGR